MNRSEFINNIKRRIKMKVLVNPTTSEQIQKLCIEHGIYWSREKRDKVDYVNKMQLYIGDKCFYYSLYNDAVLDYFYNSNSDFMIIDAEEALRDTWTNECAAAVKNALKDLYDENTI